MVVRTLEYAIIGFAIVGLLAGILAALFRIHEALDKIVNKN